MFTGTVQNCSICEIKGTFGFMKEAHCNGYEMTVFRLAAKKYHSNYAVLPATGTKSGLKSSKHFPHYNALIRQGITVVGHSCMTEIIRICAMNISYLHSECSHRFKTGM